MGEASHDSLSGSIARTVRIRSAAVKRVAKQWFPQNFVPKVAG
jgi:hypothetical protein